MTGKMVVAAGLAALAQVASFGGSPAVAGTFTADFTAGVDPKLKSSSNLKVMPVLTAGNGLFQIADAASASGYDLGVARLATTFTVTGDFTAHVTMQTTGYVEGGLEVFSGTAPASVNNSVSNDAVVYGNSGQGTGFVRPRGSGSAVTQSYTTLDLRIQRTGTAIDLFYDRGDGLGYREGQPGQDMPGLGGAVSLALFAANFSGQASAKFSNFTVTGGAVADAGPSAVPEPGTWATGLAGFGLLGLALRRRARAGGPVRA